MAHQLVHLGRSTEEREERAYPNDPSIVPEYPPECCFCLTEELVEKLGLAREIEKGDVIDIRMIAKVTSVSEHNVNGEYSCRVECTPIIMGVNSEETEEFNLEEV